MCCRGYFYFTPVGQKEGASRQRQELPAALPQQGQEEPGAKFSLSGLLLAPLALQLPE